VSMLEPGTEIADTRISSPTRFKTKQEDVKVLKLGRRKTDWSYNLRVKASPSE